VYRCALFSDIYEMLTLVLNKNWRDNSQSKIVSSIGLVLLHFVKYFSLFKGINQHNLRKTVYFTNRFEKTVFYISSVGVKILHNIIQQAACYFTSQILVQPLSFKTLKCLTLFSLRSCSFNLPKIVWGGVTRTPPLYFLIVIQIYNIWYIFKKPLGSTLIFLY